MKNHRHRLDITEIIQNNTKKLLNEMIITMDVEYSQKKKKKKKDKTTTPPPKPTKNQTKPKQNKTKQTTTTKKQNKTKQNKTKQKQTKNEQIEEKETSSIVSKDKRKFLYMAIGHDKLGGQKDKKQQYEELYIKQAPNQIVPTIPTAVP